MQALQALLALLTLLALLALLGAAASEASRAQRTYRHAAGVASGVSAAQRGEWRKGSAAVTSAAHSLVTARRRSCSLKSDCSRSERARSTCGSMSGGVASQA